LNLISNCTNKVKFDYKENASVHKYTKADKQHTVSTNSTSLKHIALHLIKKALFFKHVQFLQT